MYSFGGSGASHRADCSLSIPQVQGNAVALQKKRSWLLFNITAYSLHLAAALTFCLELNFFHYVCFFPTVFKFGHLEAFRYRSLQLLSLYSLCSRRPYGGRLVYYLSISSAGVVGLCLATTAAGHAEFNWNHVGLAGEVEAIVCVLWRSDRITSSQVSPVGGSLETASQRTTLQPDSLKDESNGVTAFIDYCRIHFFCHFFQWIDAKGVNNVTSHHYFSITVAKIDASLIWKINSKHQLLVPYGRNSVFISDWHLPDSGRANDVAKRKLEVTEGFWKINGQA